MASIVGVIDLQRILQKGLAGAGVLRQYGVTRNPNDPEAGEVVAIRVKSAIVSGVRAPQGTAWGDPFGSVSVTVTGSADLGTRLPSNSNWLSSRDGQTFFSATVNVPLVWAGTQFDDPPREDVGEGGPPNPYPNHRSMVDKRIFWLGFHPASAAVINSANVPYWLRPGGVWPNSLPYAAWPDEPAIDTDHVTSSGQIALGAPPGQPGAQLIGNVPPLFSETVTAGVVAGLAPRLKLPMNHARSAGFLGLNAVTIDFRGPLVYVHP